MKTPPTPAARSRVRDNPNHPTDLPVFLRGSEQMAQQAERPNQLGYQPAGIQKKSPSVSEPTDASEKEADEVARNVVDGQAAQIRGSG
ncbi:MAG TPA: hypothetical protein VEW46_06470, partial [Pyrinomonadaceae bacterium]|nr:hypothetical protein [Pyrinomonadaceae bacterium]